MTLTPRQRRILEMRARSMTNAAIAHAEGVSLAMVKRETEAIFAKTGAGTMEEAIAKELVPILVEEHVRGRRKRRRPTQADTLGLLGG